MTTTPIQQFKLDELERFKQQHPTIPYPESFLRGKDRYCDTTANGLTKLVIRWLNFYGYYARRISVEGRVVDKRKIVTDTLGFKRQIGSVSRIKSSMVKGSADISCVGPNGKALEIEVKIKRDVQSDHQKKFQYDIEKAGGYYIIVSSFDDFHKKFEEVYKNIVS